MIAWGDCPLEPKLSPATAPQRNAGPAIVDGELGVVAASGSPAPAHRPAKRAERLVELSALVERLTRVIDPSYIGVWLRNPVPALDDGKPLEIVCGDHGEPQKHLIRIRVSGVRSLFRHLANAHYMVL
jgi:hypothetical protein